MERKLGGTGQKWAQLFGPLYTHCMQFPYAHRLESGNIPFQNIQKIFTGLENAFAVLGASWKPHKSKVRSILHRSLLNSVRGIHGVSLSCMSITKREDMDKNP